MPRRDKNTDYLNTWQSINQAGGPTKPVRSHILSGEEPRLTSGRGKKIRPLLESEPLTENSIPSFVKNRLPMGDVAMGELNPTADNDEAISWYSTKENRIASGLALLQKMRSIHPEGSKMRELIENSYRDYPRTFAHLGNFQNVKDKNLGFHSIEENPMLKFSRSDPGDPSTMTLGKPWVNKLRPSRELALAQDLEPRKNLLNNAINIEPEYLKTGDMSSLNATMREEMSHAAQNIRKPYEHAKEVAEGRGQLLGIHGVPPNLKTTTKHLDYMLEPVEVGGKYGKERGISTRRIKSKIFADLPKKEIKDLETGMEPWPKDIKATTARPAKSHADYLNDQLDLLTKNFKTAAGFATDEPMLYGNTGKLYTSKSDFPKIEHKVRAKAVAKIKDKVLPYLNRSRPADDQIILTLRDRPIDPTPFYKDPDFGEFLKEIRVQRASKVRK